MNGYLISTPARQLPCPSCGAPVLAAITGGLPITADPRPLSAADEITALLAGRVSYDIHIHGLPRRLYLERRDVDRIRSREHAIVASHPCRVLVPAAAGTEITVTAVRPLPDEPPF